MTTIATLSTAQLRTDAQPFDGIAAIYDHLFTDSAIGKAQRAQVIAEVNRCFQPGDHILELNCGTGEDALALGRRGVKVSAYDASPAMIDVASRKLQDDPFQANVRFGILRNEDLALLTGPFDGALSNFAGMNCSHDWQSIASRLSRLVEPGGHLLLCIMGRTCLWEILYFLLRAQPRKAFRRAFRNRVAQVGDSSVRVHYVSVHQARRAFASGFTLRAWRGVGVCVPPSYFEPHLNKHSTLLRLLGALDSRIGHIAGIRFLADHVLLDFVRHTA